MIDTDKYEGHTPAPWFPPDFGGEGLLDNKGRVMALLVYDEEEPQTSDEWLANAQLIADAPFLFAEVKRLRERLIRAYDWAENAVNGNDSAMMDYTEYVCGDD
jgi:hypothetical protein|tara:strand:- start:133 stop:441 length:309 start_codon:yes stop_codon:yes gene_type:complete